MQSFGLFLNITTVNRTEIEKRISFLENMENLGHVEVWLEHGDWTDDDSRWLKKKLAGFKILVHAPFISFSFVATHREINEASLVALKRACEHAEMLGSKVMTLHVGRKPLYLLDEEARKIAISHLTSLVEYVDGKFDLAIENLPASSGTSLRYPVTLREVECIIQEVPHLKATVDVGHCIQNEDSYEWFFEKYATRISDIHVHNAIKKSKAHFGFGTPGDLDLQKFILFLNRISYGKYFTFEILGDKDIRESWDKLQAIIKE